MNIIFFIVIFTIFFFHDDLESSEQSPALEEKNIQVKDRPGLGSLPQNEPKRSKGRLKGVLQLLVSK